MQEKTPTTEQVAPKQTEVKVEEPKSHVFRNIMIALVVLFILIMLGLFLMYAVTKDKMSVWTVVIFILVILAMGITGWIFYMKYRNKDLLKLDNSISIQEADMLISYRVGNSMYATSIKCPLTETSDVPVYGSDKFKFVSKIYQMTDGRRLSCVLNRQAPTQVKMHIHNTKKIDDIDKWILKLCEGLSGIEKKTTIIRKKHPDGTVTEEEIQSNTQVIEKQDYGLFEG